MSKGDSAFCYPEHIARQMRELFADLKRQQYFHRLSVDDFAAGATRFLSTLNAIHPFREGNGRTQTTFLVLLADRAGHPLDLDKLVPERFLGAMIASFEGNEQPLELEIGTLIG
jgi:cell filamentation protein